MGAPPVQLVASSSSIRELEISLMKVEDDLNNAGEPATVCPSCLDIGTDWTQRFFTASDCN